LCFEKGTAFKEYYNETFKTKQNDWTKQNVQEPN
jgi:hypothetical protein